MTFALAPDHVIALGLLAILAALAPMAWRSPGMRRALRGPWGRR